MKVSIRNASERDLPRIFEIEKRSYPPWLQAPRKAILRRFELGGIIVAVDRNGKVLGFSSMIPANLPWRQKMKLFEKIMRNRSNNYLPWFNEYENCKEFNTLWVASTAVESSLQGKGIGGKLIEASLRIARKKGLRLRASALKCEYAKKRLANENVEHYLARVKSGTIKDRFLQPYLKRGFRLDLLLPEYEPDSPRRKESNVNYNVLAYKKVM